MTRWWRSSRWSRRTLALLLCGAGLVVAPAAPAGAAPSADAGLGTVVADLGTVPQDAKPGFSDDGAYFAYLVTADDRCALRVYDVAARKPVTLTHDLVQCSYSFPRWAAHADTLIWQVDAAFGYRTVYAWDAVPGRVTTLASDAHVLAQWDDYGFMQPSVSADGRFLAFAGRSYQHPAPPVDDATHAWFVFDRTTGVSLPLSKPDVHVDFVSWSPAEDNFVGQTGGHSPRGPRTGACFGSQTSCEVVLDVYAGVPSQWSGDGSTVINAPGRGSGLTVYDFAQRAVEPAQQSQGVADFGSFVGGDAQRVLLYVGGRLALWDRRTDAVSLIDLYGGLSPDGRYVLHPDAAKDAFRYRDLTTGVDAQATYRGVRGGWTSDGANFLGIGPGGCSSLRQWSPVTNTVSLFGPPGLRTCYDLRRSFTGVRIDSPSGRFTLVAKVTGDKDVTYVADLRRHVLIGPVRGVAQTFSPAGSDLLVVQQDQESAAPRVLLVDPTPSPDVDDQPRFSAATPANGARIEAAVGDQVQVELGASDLQQTPVNLFFRWRNTAGDPIASAPRGWTCERKRLGAGATRSVCTFAPPKDHTDVRFVDVWAVNYVTGAQSDTRSYRVSAR